MDEMTQNISEDDLTKVIATVREKFIDLGQEPSDGCSMERFIARELLIKFNISTGEN